MLELLKKYNNNLAVYDKKNKYTYKMLRTMVLNAMKDISYEDEIAICMQHGIRYLIYMLAAIEKGVTVYLLNPNIKSDSLCYLKSRNVKIYIDKTTSDYFIREGLYENLLLVELDKKKIDMCDDEEYITSDVKANLVLSTSGTTSNTTKFVKIPFNNILLKSYMIAAHLGICESDSTLFFSPLCFVQTLWTAFIHLLNGASIYFTTFDTLKFDDELRNNNITTLITVPAVVRGIIDKNKSSYNLRLLSIGGDYMDDNLLEKLRVKWGDVLYANVYGATETCAADTIFDPRPFRELDVTFYSLGKSTEYSKVFIISEDGKIMGKNEIGYICVQSPFLIDHYLNIDIHIRNEKGYFMTYDKGYIDGDSRLHYTGRDSSIIVRNGKKIAACEVENVIYGIPGVDEVVVVGERHSIYGQVPVAYIVVKQEIMEQDIKDVLYDRLESYKVPKKIVFVSKLIKTNSGKVIRNSELYEKYS